MMEKKKVIILTHDGQPPVQSTLAMMDLLSDQYEFKVCDFFVEMPIHRETLVFVDDLLKLDIGHMTNVLGEPRMNQTKNVLHDARAKSCKVGGDDPAK